MLKTLFYIIYISLIFNFSFFAQSKYTISGHVRDSKSGEELLYATIFVDELKKGVTTNQYGFYSITLKQGKYKLIYGYLGYKEVIKEISLDRNIKLNIELEEETELLQEVEIVSYGPNANIARNEMSVAKIDIKEIESVPVLMGEMDVLKTIQLFPGVSSTSEGSSGFYVRGGGIDQNLILLDEAPVFNAGHLVGFFSVFNSDAITDVKLIKSAIPAQYGGRLSSLLDIKMKNGNMRQYTASGGIGLISSRLTAEGPIIKDKSSFIISGRRTYGDIAFKFADQKRLKESQVYFYDFNVKTNLIISEKDRVFLSGYYGRDVMKYSDEFGFDYGNATNTFRWNHLFSNKLFSNLSVIYSKYNYDIEIYIYNDFEKLSSGIDNFNIKDDFTWFVHPNFTLKAGFNSIYYMFQPGKVNHANNSQYNLVIDKKYALENSVYLVNELKCLESLQFVYGLRYSWFYAIGPGKEYTFYENVPADTITYKKNEIFKTYDNLEPRIIANFILNPSTSIKASYSRNAQYIHLMSNATASIPTDLWIPSSTLVKPEKADQYALGFYKNFRNNEIESSVEFYYKNLLDQIDYKNGSNTLFNPFLEADLVFGTGRAYGAEFYIKKKYGKLNGWLSYTISKTERKFKEINNGNYFPAKYDRKHDFSIVAIYDLNKKISFSATWVYYTGEAVTFPSGKYLVDNMPISLYTERNGYRMPDYHRLDIGCKIVSQKQRKFQSIWVFSIYNVYARENAFMVFFRHSEENPDMFDAVQLALFSIVPSISWNFKF